MARVAPTGLGRFLVAFPGFRRCGDSILGYYPFLPLGGSAAFGPLEHSPGLGSGG